MAGGQSASLETGSLGESADVPLVGTEALLADGTLVVEAAPVEEALTGDELVAAQETPTSGALVRLRSRKASSSSAAYQLSGIGASLSSGALVQVPSSAMVGSVATFAQGAFTKVRTKPLSGAQIVGATGTAVGNGAAPQAWTVGNIELTEGDSGLPGGVFSVIATGPASYATGGYYDSLSGTSLPTGMTLSDDGLLDVGTATATSVSNAVFGYTEPSALSTLTLHANSAGTLPYMATVYPCEGAVPGGSSVTSPDDSALRGSVLSSWPDGSAQVIVVAGQKTVTAGSTTTVRLRPAVISGTNLTTAAIASKFTTGISVNFGGGVQTLNSWGSPDRIWWANSQVICARYRLSCGLGTMVAVIDVHAFASNHALVEVVIENGTVNADSSIVTLPDNRSYTNATVSVNGTTIATVSSPSSGMTAPNSRQVSGTPKYFGGHSASRAWYCSAKVVSGTVTPLTTAQHRAETFGIEVTHDADSLMAHPWFFKKAVPVTYNLQTKYAQTYDTYVPWSYNRLRYPGFNDGGGDEEIGLITSTQADYVLNGSKYARRATLETGLAPLSCDLAIRHTDGTVPTRAQIVGKNTSNGNWPRVPESSTQYCLWGGDSRYIDGSHVPNIALVPFLCRPSPCFIELAQREFLFHHANYNSVDGSHSADQARSRGWRARNMATAIFLTPDSDSTRKDGYRTALVANLSASNTFFSRTSYDMIQDLTADSDPDADGGRERVQYPTLMNWYLSWCWHSIANGKVLRGADQTLIEGMADRIMKFVVRWFTEATDYEWRACPYQTTVGVFSSPNAIAQESTLPQEHFYNVTGTKPNAPGPWLNFGGNGYDWQDAVQVKPQYVANDPSTVYYPEHTWVSLCCAVERGISGADAAWIKVYGTSGNGGITEFSTWAAGLGTDRPYLNRFPRNK